MREAHGLLCSTGGAGAAYWAGSAWIGTAAFGARACVESTATAGTSKDNLIKRGPVVHRPGHSSGDSHRHRHHAHPTQTAYLARHPHRPLSAPGRSPRRALQPRRVGTSSAAESCARVPLQHHAQRHNVREARRHSVFFKHLGNHSQYYPACSPLWSMSV